MSDHTFSRFAYFDTNILSQLAKDRNLWPGLAAYLLDNDLTLALGSQAAELSDVPRLHDALSNMLVSVPAAVIKTWDTVLDEELAAHPGRRADTLLAYPLNALIIEEGGPAKLWDFLSSHGLSQARQGQREAASHLPARLALLKSNFPPASDGKYKKEQAPLFAFALTIQWLSAQPQHRRFLQQYTADVTQFRDTVFKSVRLHAYVIYYKYYLGGRTPEPSDFGDLSHLYALPYCPIVVVERDMANVLRQVQRHDDVLSSTEVLDIDFLKRFA